MFDRRHFLHTAGSAGIASILALSARAGADPAIRPIRTAPELLLPPDLIFPDAATKAPPPKNFASNHNYFIYAGGMPIVGLTVTIDVHEDIVDHDGMSMQLNCFSPAGANCVLQQYVTGSSSLAKSQNLLFGSSIENFPADAYRAQLHQTIGLPAKGDLFNEHFHFGSFPLSSGRIPKGFRLKWRLIDGNEPTPGTIVGAQYSVTDANGNVQTSGPQHIRAFTFTHTKVRVTPDAMAPILALQMNMVGTNNGQFMYIASGAGTITYEASIPLTPQGIQPSTTAAQGKFTKETTNIHYAELGSAPTTKIVQKFRAKPSETEG